MIIVIHLPNPKKARLNTSSLFSLHTHSMVAAGAPPPTASQHHHRPPNSTTHPRQQPPAPIALKPLFFKLKEGEILIMSY